MDKSLIETSPWSLAMLVEFSVKFIALFMRDEGCLKLAHITVIQQAFIGYSCLKWNQKLYGVEWYMLCWVLPLKATCSCHQANDRFAIKRHWLSRLL